MKKKKCLLCGKWFNSKYGRKFCKADCKKKSEEGTVVHYIYRSEFEKLDSLVDMSVEIDMEDKLRAMDILCKRHHLCSNYTDWFLMFDRDTGNLVKVHPSVSKAEVEKYIVNHPDIVTFDQRGKLLYVVEIDGSYHKSRSGARQTEKRNRYYAQANLRYIILDKEDLEYIGMSWEQCIDEEISRYNFSKQKYADYTY